MDRVYFSRGYDGSVEHGRYHRQEILPGVGRAGQERLRGAHAVIVGVGALGCAASDQLARAGVGRLTLIDRDLVDRTNLQRQILFSERDAAEGLPKVEAARRRLAEINSEVKVFGHIADLTGANADGLVIGDAPPGVIIDGTDNFETRYILNDVAVKHGVPYAYGGVVGTRGMQMTIRPGETACLRCVFEEQPAPGSQPTCDTAGVLGPAAAIVAACQAADAMRIMLGQGREIAPTLLEFDVWEGRRRRIDLARAKRPDCPACGAGRFEFLGRGSGGGAASLCGQHAIQVTPGGAHRVDLRELAGRLGSVGDVAEHPFMVRCTLAGESAETGGCLELTVFRDGRAIVKGTSRPERARSVYARYIGA